MGEELKFERRPDGEWRVLDEHFALKLGYEDSPEGRRLFRHLIANNEEILNKFNTLERGSVFSRNENRGRKGGVACFWLNETQAMYIASQSKMPNANEATVLLYKAIAALRKNDIDQARLYGAAGGELLGLSPRVWKKVYDDDFAALVHDLGNWRHGDGTWNSQVAHFINRYVYIPLFGELGHKALCEANPMLDSGSRAVRQHQWLKEKHLPRLLEHIGALKVLMRNAVSLQMFDDMFNRAFQQKNTQIGFLFDERRPS